MDPIFWLVVGSLVLLVAVFGIRWYEDKPAQPQVQVPPVLAPQPVAVQSAPVADPKVTPGPGV